MDLSPELIKQLLQVFEAELSEQLQVITDVLLQLEKGIEGDTRKKALDQMFRAAHNIKGAARGVSVTSVADISHELETLFIGFKEKLVDPTPKTIDLCLNCLDRMSDAMVSHTNGSPLTFDLEDLLNQLRAHHPGDDSQVQEQKAVPAGKARSETSEELPEPTEDSRHASPAQENPMPLAGAKQQSVNVDIGRMSKLSAHSELLQLTKIHLEDNLYEVRTLYQKIQHISSLWRRTHLGDLSASTVLDDSDRIFVETLHGLNELNDLGGQIQQTLSGNSKRLGVLTESIRNDVRMMRLVPAGTLLRPMERVVRDIARELGKKIDIDIMGDEIEIDRKVLDGIRDPLIHLVRNSIDHGIEHPAERKSLGKPEAGHLTLEVSSSSGQIMLTIEDDGAGISETKIAETALRKKLLSEEELEELSSSQLLDLIFRPGFSSKEIITHISGRGVGLDVVKANLNSLKGTVSIVTEVGKFTRFTLTLPLTLATDRGLVVSISGQGFAIPTTNVDRVLTLKQEDIAEVSGGSALLFEGRTIPVISLANVLKLTPMESAFESPMNIVVVSRAWNVVAFEVDEIVGERELVIKPLLPPLNKIRHVSGGTQTGSGEIIMVLNPEQILDSAIRPGMMVSSSKQVDETKGKQRQRILVVDDSISVRTLEKSIFEDHGYQVNVAVDGKKAWEVVQKEPFDLIVTDIEMPNMDGFEFTRRVKESEKFSDIPIIIVSSLDNESDRKRGIEVGADAYIVKGQFETKALMDVVVQLI